MFKDYYTQQFQKIFASSLQPSDALSYDIIQVKLADRRLSLPPSLILCNGGFGSFQLKKQLSKRLNNTVVFPYERSVRFLGFSSESIPQEAEEASDDSA
jgi:hypothetical protein